MTSGKAVRDRIPDIIGQSGRSCDAVRLPDGEFLKRLEEKLYEELDEYAESGSVEELADILEIVYRIAALKGVTRDRLEQVRLDKAEERGAFENNVFLAGAGAADRRHTE